MFQVNIFTLYPEFFPGLLNAGNYRRARVNKIWDFNIVNLREFTGSNQRADDKPFGGGSGMVIKAEVISKALNKYKNGFEKVLLSPRGLKLDQNLVENYKNKTGLNLICGHFEGVDQRVIDKENIKEISIGDYVLSGGESASFVFLDAIVRTLPGVLGDPKSLNEESFSGDLLEYPQYTQPRDWNGIEVPEVLLSGNHAEIKNWRLEQSRSITQRQRPDLWQKYTKKS